MVRMNRKPIGDSGSASNGFDLDYQTEFSSELIGRQGNIIYSKMAKSDPQIGMILKIHKNPIKSCDWGFEELEDATPQEEKVLEVLNKWFFEESPILFESLLSQVLTNVEHGFSLFERVWSDFQCEGVRYHMPILEQRLQESIEHIYPLRRIVQQARNKGGLVDISFDDLVFFTLDMMGSDLRGTSMIRNAYKPWRDKLAYETYLGIGAQRSATGIPSMEVPDGTDINGAEYLAAETLLRNIAAGEDAYMITQEGWSFKIEAPSFNSEQLLKAIMYKDSQMALSVLAQFVLLGQQGKGGSYALGRDQSDMFLDGLQFVITFIEKVFFQQVITPTVKINFGDTVDIGRIRLKGKNLNKKAGSELADVLTKLSAAGFIKPEITDEQKFRKELELSELSEEQMEERKERKEKMANLAPNAEGEDGEDDEEGTDRGNRDPKKKSSGKQKPTKLAEKSLPQQKGRRAFVDKETKLMQEFMYANLVFIKEKLRADIRNILNKGKTPLQGLKKIELQGIAKYRVGLERRLASIANKGWMDMKRMAKGKNIKLAEPINPSGLEDKMLKAFVVNQAEILVEDQAVAMKAKAINSAQNSIMRGLAINQALANVDEVIDEFLDSTKLQVGAQLSVVSSINFGNDQFNKTIADELWGFRFVNADPKTEICKHYAGQVFRIDQDALGSATPPLHPNCNSHLEPIYKTEEKPEFTGKVAPPSIQKQRSIK